MLPRQLSTSGLSRRTQAGIVASAIALIVVVACAPEAKDKFMRTFFDGYPRESKAPAPASTAEPAATQPSLAVEPEPAGQLVTWSGSVSEVHAGIADDCNACHGPQKTVTAAMCTECHDLRPHGGAEAFGRCGSCHQEHSGRDFDLKRVSSSTCSACHSFAPFESKHPEFAALAKADAAAKPETGLTMVHSAHSGAECADCHPKRSGADVAHQNPGRQVQGQFDPVKYAACADCHEVEDHGTTTRFDVTEVLSSLPAGANRSTLLLSNAQFERQLEQSDDETVKSALQAVREQLVAGEREPCFLCHSFTLVSEGGTQYATAKVTYPDRWFPAARFSHQTHDEIDCDSCHAVPADRARELERPILPTRAACAECHNADGAAADCFTCHAYHPGA